MHELSIAVDIVDVVVAEAKRYDARRVEAVTCRVGAMRQIVPAMLIEAFGIAAAGSPAEGAALDVQVVPATMTCRACGRTSEPREIELTCPHCGSVDVAIEGGDELVVASLSLELPDER